MKFGMMIDTHVDKWKLIQHAEELGFHRAWIPDSQMIWADCYVTMGLAAVNTKRILIGTGMTTPGTRIAPVTAHSIGSINQLAPGRVFLGIATGHTSMRLIGQPPISPSELREYVGVLRKLLDGEAVDYTYRGRTAEIQFMHRDRYYVNLDNRIPIYMPQMARRRLPRLANSATAGCWRDVPRKRLRRASHRSGARQRKSAGRFPPISWPPVQAALAFCAGAKS